MAFFITMSSPMKIVIQISDLISAHRFLDLEKQEDSPFQPKYSDRKRLSTEDC